MARPLRIEYPGAWYHVMNRGRRKEEIFFEEEDYALFLNVLKEAHQLFKIEIHAYALMPNHYHLLVHTPLGNVSRAMRHIGGVYTQKINNKRRVDGSLFRGRYKSIVVDAEEYLKELIRYIHRNPVKAGLEENPGEYQWCSHTWYRKEKGRPRFLQTKTVLGLFGDYEKEAARELESFVRKEVPHDLMKILEGVKWPSILGGEKFKKKIEGLLKGKKIEAREIPQYKSEIALRNIWGAEEVKRFLKENEGIIAAKQSRNLSRSRQRRAVIYVMKEQTAKSNREIAGLIGGITDAAVSWQYRKAVEEVENKTGCWKEVRQLLKKS